MAFGKIPGYNNRGTELKTVKSCTVGHFNPRFMARLYNTVSIFLLISAGGSRTATHVYILNSGRLTAGLYNPLINNTVSHNCALIILKLLTENDDLLIY